MHRFIAAATILLILAAPSAFAAGPEDAAPEGERLYLQQDVARLVAEALSGKGDDPEAIGVEFSPALPTFRLPPDAEGILVEEVSTDPTGRRFAARLALPIGTGNVHRQTVTGQIHRLTRVPVLARPIARGETIAADDVEWIQLKDSRLGSSVIVDATELVGPSARGSLRAGSPVRPAQVRKPVVVAKGSLVLLVLDRPGMALSARGRALEDGGVGEPIRVSNLQSSVVVEGTVTGPGRVDVSVPGRFRTGEGS